MGFAQVEKESIETARRGADAVWKKCKEALAAREQQLAPIRELRQRRNALAEELAGYARVPVCSTVDAASTAPQVQRPHRSFRG